MFTVLLCQGQQSLAHHPQWLPLVIGVKCIGYLLVLIH